MARPLRIVGLGDSTIAGTPGFQSPIEAPPDGRGNPESQCGYWMMQAHPEWTVLNRGVNGERSDEIRTRFARDVLEARPDYVIVLAGVNDIFQGLLPEAVERNLGPIYAAASAWLVLGEPVLNFHWVGAALILPGIYLSTRPAAGKG